MYRLNCRFNLVAQIMVVPAFVALTASSPPCHAADVAAPKQLPGEHSTLTTFDGSIRDDELAEYVCSRIPKDTNGVPQVRDVKIMFNSCYGGGMLDDFERVFGPGGPCDGVRWVGGAASGPNQPALGPNDAVVAANPGKNLGSRWTNALHPAIQRRNVKISFEIARDKDVAGPKGYHGEDPVVASGNGGDAVQWHEHFIGHTAVVFGGRNNKLRHNNNIHNMGNALSTVWGSSLKYMGFGWGDIATGTTAHLKALIDAACSHLNAKTELVLYFDDHGDTDFDIDEFTGWLMPSVISGLTTIDFNLHSGWVEGLEAMDAQPDDEPLPKLKLSLVDSILGSEWSIALNSTPVPLPAGAVSGQVELPVDWTAIQTGANRLELSPVATPSSPMILENLELSSGPINEAEDSLVAAFLDETQQRCINAVNMGSARVAAAKRKENATCVKKAGRGQLVGTAEECLVANLGNKVARAQQRNLNEEARKCVPGQLPDFGYTGAANGNVTAVAEENNLLHDIFGLDLDAAIMDIATHKAAATCQTTVLKAYEKLVSAKISVFLTCKKNGLSGNAMPRIIDAAGLASCINDPGYPGSIKEDSRGRIAKARARLVNAIDMRCNGVVLSAAFPGQCSSTGDFANCVDERAECRVCLMLNAIDDLNTDCDVFDDTIANSSCPPGIVLTGTIP